MGLHAPLTVDIIAVPVTLNEFSVGCKPIVLCTSGQSRCNGKVIEQCNQAGSAWVTIKTCEHACEIQNNVAVCAQPPEGCNVDADCDDRDVCTKDTCEFDILKGRKECKHEAISGCGGGGGVDPNIMKYLPYIVLALIVVLFVVVALKTKKKGKGRKYYVQ